MASSPEISSQAGCSYAAPAGVPIALDGHVHLQADMPYSRIADNFLKAAPGHTPVCMVVESAGIDRFAELTERLEPWGQLGLFDQETGLRFVAGRQVVSEEGLEILLLGSRDQSLEGKPTERIIAAGLEHGSAVCLPWGFGKWLGSRRRLAAELYDKLKMQILLGDITNRPAIWRESLFSDARVLRGSDNLPMAGSSDTVGLFGSTISARHAVDMPEDLIALLRDPLVPLAPYGRRKSARASISEQVRLRLTSARG